MLYLALKKEKQPPTKEAEDLLYTRCFINEILDYLDESNAQNIRKID
jgi:hypothetical protein